MHNPTMSWLPSLSLYICLYIFKYIYFSLSEKHNTIKMNIVPHKQNLLALMPCLPKKIICGCRRVAATNQVTVRRHPLPSHLLGGDDAQHQLAIVFEFYHAALDIFAIWSCIHLLGGQCHVTMLSCEYFSIASTENRAQ